MAQRFIHRNKLCKSREKRCHQGLRNSATATGNYAGRHFKPTGTPLAGLAHIKILRDELEVLKLCDYEGLNQQEAGERIGISRGTVQRLLVSARKKVAEALSQGAALIFVDEDNDAFPVVTP